MLVTVAIRFPADFNRTSVMVPPVTSPAPSTMRSIPSSSSVVVTLLVIAMLVVAPVGGVIPAWSTSVIRTSQL
jgi:hypothetical protein